MKRLILLWRNHPFMITAFILAAGLTVLFIIRVVTLTIYFANPTHRDQTLEPWMTPGYVAHSWDMPREVMVETLDLSIVPKNKLKTMGQIATERDLTMDELSALIETAAKAHRSEIEMDVR